MIACTSPLESSRSTPRRSSAPSIEACRLRMIRSGMDSSQGGESRCEYGGGGAAPVVSVLLPPGYPSPTAWYSGDMPDVSPIQLIIVLIIPLAVLGPKRLP